MKNSNEKDAFVATTNKLNKTVIVPVAIPGCGAFSFSFQVRTFCLVIFSDKTSVSLALAHIFGFGHTQSDDVPNKKTRTSVYQKCGRSLAQKKMVS